MSHLGHKRTLKRIETQSRDVRFVPLTDIRLFKRRERGMLPEFGIPGFGYVAFAFPMGRDIVASLTPTILNSENQV